jgi:hypothetical protein
MVNLLPTYFVHYSDSGPMLKAEDAGVDKADEATPLL